MKRKLSEVEIWDSMVIACEKSLEHAKHRLAKARAKENELADNEQPINES